MEFDENGAVTSTTKADQSAVSDRIGEHAFLDGVRSLNGLTRWAVYGLTAYLIAEFVYFLISLMLIWLYLPSTIVPFSQSQLALIDWFIVGVGLAQAVTFWFCVVLVGRVTFRAMKNLYTIGSKFPEMSPGWAVGWYFIPIANLWQPARGMSQIYRGTFHAIGEGIPSESRLPIWWTCWLLTNFAANISLRTGGFDNNGMGITTFSFDAASSIFGALSAWALIQLIKPISEAQELLKHGGVAHVFD